MLFHSAKEMLDCIVKKDNDLYNPVLEEYVFHYNDAGAICVYGIDNKKASNLQKDAEKYSEYWSAFLGPGGSIYDDPEDTLNYFEGQATNLDYCEEVFRDSNWMPTTEVSPL